jgi:hypothetical protein
MKSSLAILAVLGIVTTSALVMDNVPKTEVTKGKFGAMEAVEWLDEGMSKTVYCPDKAYRHDYV